MAELILQTGSSGTLQHFDFDPGNTMYLEAIEAILAGNIHYPGLREHQLASICELSIGTEHPEARQSTGQKHPAMVRTVYRWYRSGFGNRRSRGNIPGAWYTSTGIGFNRRCVSPS